MASSNIEVDLELLLKSKQFQAGAKAAQKEFKDFKNSFKDMENSLKEMSGYFDGFFENLSAGLAENAVMATIGGIQNTIANAL